MVLQVTTRPDGSLSVLFFSPGEASASLSGANVQFNGTNFSFDLPVAKARYEGVLAQDKNTIHGTWIQGARLPLDFQRGNKPIADAQRPQEPKPPFPYDVEQVSYGGGADTVRLAGTLTKPRGAGPFPAVLLIPGSGPRDRDETLFGHKPFLLLADTLTRHGIAVLRYDDRGVGQSTGDLSKATSADLAADAEAGARYLLSRSDISARHIGLLGHSEGAMIAPMVASKDPRIAFLVLLGAPAVPGDQLMLAQQKRIAEMAGVPEAQEQKLHQALAKVYSMMREGKTNQEIEAGAKSLFGSPETAAGAFKMLSVPWFRYYLSYDPATALDNVHCPVLAMYGAKDVQVIPEQNVPPLKAALEKAGDRDVTVMVLPGLNHLLQDCKTGLPAEYGTIAETMSPVVLNKITKWIERHVK